MHEEIIVRPFESGDPISDITKLLHRAYAQLAQMGFRYLATHQDDAITLGRLTDGASFLAVRDAAIVGTITCYDSGHTSGSPFLDRDGVGHIGQFGVEPSLQRRGIGHRLFNRAEEHAYAMGLEEVALDTAEGARHLIDWYRRLGYRFVEYVSWEVTNYRSVVLAKKLR